MMNDRSPQIKIQIGNLSILEQPKTAFLCSRQVPADAVLKCYDWAIQMREAGRCVISGFHSPIEQDVLHYLLKGKQPVIMALARGVKTSWEPSIQKALEEGRLLIITPFGEGVKRASADTAAVRNDLMIQLADDIVVGYAAPDGMLARRLRLEREKQVEILV
jgi:predicted Rossmann fold nucleotide-binding protein DprA/Smf involved in DNA uptake